MNRHRWISGLFWLAAAYDGLLGFAFLFAGGRVYDAIGVTPPNHWGYIQFPAALLIVFAVMFARIAARPGERRELVLYAIGLKIAYVGVTLYHAVAASIPDVWLYFTVADAAFLIAFVWAYVAAGKPARAGS